MGTASHFIVFNTFLGSIFSRMAHNTCNCLLTAYGGIYVSFADVVPYTMCPHMVDTQNIAHETVSYLGESREL